MSRSDVNTIYTAIETHLIDNHGFVVTRTTDRRMAHRDCLVNGAELRTVGRGVRMPVINQGLPGPLAVEMGYGSYTLRVRVLVGPELRWIGDVTTNDPEAYKAWLPKLDEAVSLAKLYVDKTRADWRRANPAEARKADEILKEAQA